MEFFQASRVGLSSAFLETWIFVRPTGNTTINTINSTTTTCRDEAGPSFDSSAFCIHRYVPNFVRPYCCTTTTMVLLSTVVHSYDIRVRPRIMSMQPSKKRSVLNFIIHLVGQQRFIGRQCMRQNRQTGVHYPKSTAVRDSRSCL